MLHLPELSTHVPRALQAYSLTVEDIPLVKLVREPEEGQPSIEDTSAGAQDFLSEQRYQAFRREHPKLGLPPHQRAAVSQQQTNNKVIQLTPPEDLHVSQSSPSPLAVYTEEYTAEANTEGTTAAASSKVEASAPAEVVAPRSSVAASQY